MISDSGKYSRFGYPDIRIPVEITKNSDGKPSIPGHLLFFICFRELLISLTVSKPSRDSASVTDSLCKLDRDPDPSNRIQVQNTLFF